MLSCCDEATTIPFVYIFYNISTVISGPVAHPVCYFLRMASQIYTWWPRGLFCLLSSMILVWPNQLLGGTYSTSLSASGDRSSLLGPLPCYVCYNSEGPDNWREEDCWWSRQSKQRSVEASSGTAYVFLYLIFLLLWIDSQSGLPLGTD